MCDHTRGTSAGHRDDPVQRNTPAWAQRAATDRAAEWSSDRVIDPGDTHDKGEQSLCVGEAA
jgi:hypothetical protein